MLKFSCTEVIIFKLLNFRYKQYTNSSINHYLIVLSTVPTVYTINKMKNCLFDGVIRDFRGSCIRLELKLRNVTF